MSKGGVVSNSHELIQRIKIYLENSFQFEVIDDNYENIILPCLYSKVQSRDNLINNSDANEFNLRLNTLPGKHISAQYTK